MENNPTAAADAPQLAGDERPAGTLAELADLPIWVAWKRVEDPATGKIDKRPWAAFALSTKNPEHWVTLAQAFALKEQHRLDGVGLVLTGGIDLKGWRLVGIDYDGVEELTFRPLFPSSYIEPSPSGNGRRQAVWVKSEWIRDYCDNTDAPVPGTDHTEIYTGNGGARFLTLTMKGEDVGIECLADEADLARLAKYLKPAKAVTPQADYEDGEGTPINLHAGQRWTPEQQACIDGKDGVDRSNAIHGIIMVLANAGHSQADIFATMLRHPPFWQYLLDHRHNDPENAAQFAREEITRAFNRTAAGTQARVLAQWQQQAQPLAASLAASGQQPTAENDASIWPAPLDLKALARREPEAPKFIMADWMPCNYATLLAGHGGAGKSGIALTLAVCIAAGIPFFGLPVEQRNVLYLSCEDRGKDDVLHWRLARICEYLGIDLADLAGKLDIHDLVGRETILWQPPAGPTVAYHRELAPRIERSRAQVVIVDGISDTFGGNENSRTEVKAYVNAVLALIPKGGALLLVGHVNKQAAGSATSEGYSGSTGWHNSVRSRWYLHPDKDGSSDDGEGDRLGTTLRLDLQKANLAASDKSMLFVWSDTHKLFVGAQARVVSNVDHVAEQEAIVRLIETAPEPVPSAVQGQRTTYNVLSAMPGFPVTLKGAAGKKRFWQHVESLRSIRRLKEAEYSAKNRHPRRVIVSTRAGCAEYAISKD